MERPGGEGRRVALVTGASRGIGLAVARRLGDDGFHVVLSARSAAATEEAAEGIRQAGGSATAVACDVGDRESVAALLAALGAQAGRLDVLVNNAGILPKARHAEDIDYEDWDRTLEVNLTAPWYLATRAKALMGQGGGVVVNVASTASYYPSRGLVAYNVSKAGLVMLTRALALEWARDHIRVVGVAPGKVDTDLLAPIKAYNEKRGQDFNPQKRLAEAAEVAALVSFLVSEAAAYITGVVVPIDGGELLVSSSENGK
jgi:3-oxoacyl-[acyl-carrier protein] reductase